MNMSIKIKDSAKDSSSEPSMSLHTSSYKTHVVGRVVYMTMLALSQIFLPDKVVSKLMASRYKPTSDDLIIC